MGYRVKYSIDLEAERAGCVFRQPAEGDCGHDICSSVHEVLLPLEQKIIKTGLTLAIPIGLIGMIKDRSGMALKGIRVAAGIIDSSYRGEVSVVLYNHGQSPYVIEVGDRVAQILFLLNGSPIVAKCSLYGLGKTKRGKGSFGSTGK